MENNQTTTKEKQAGWFLFLNDNTEVSDEIMPKVQTIFFDTDFVEFLETVRSDVDDFFGFPEEWEVDSLEEMRQLYEDIWKSLSEKREYDVGVKKVRFVRGAVELKSKPKTDESEKDSYGPCYQCGQPGVFKRISRKHGDLLKVSCTSCQREIPMITNQRIDSPRAISLLKQEWSNGSWDEKMEDQLAEINAVQFYATLGRRFWMIAMEHMPDSYSAALRRCTAYPFWGVVDKRDNRFAYGPYFHESEARRIQKGLLNSENYKVEDFSADRSPFAKILDLIASVVGGSPI